MLIPGFFDSDGSPAIRITIEGDLGSREYTAVIDTGFTGFVALPLAEMIPLGLRTEGAASVMLGNGAVIDNLLAPGRVTIGTQTETGTIVLDETSNDILVGLAFLRKFDLALIVTDSVVVLYDRQETLEVVLNFMAAAPSGAPSPEPDPTASEGQ
jgi:predicted aspartyl protease